MTFNITDKRRNNPFGAATWRAPLTLQTIPGDKWRTRPNPVEE